MLCKQCPDLGGVKLSACAHAQKGINTAGDRKGNHGGFYHIADVPVQVRAGDGADQQGAGGHGRAPVTEEGACQYRAAAVEDGNPHAGGHGGADDSHGGGSSEGGARQGGDQTAKQKCNQHHDAGTADLCRMIDDVGNGSTNPPGGGDDADENKGDEDIIHGPNAGNSQGSHFLRSMLFVKSIPEEQKKTKYQSDQNGNIIPDAKDQSPCKQRKNADFDHVFNASKIFGFHYTPWFPGLQIKSGKKDPGMIYFSQARGGMRRMIAMIKILFICHGRLLPQKTTPFYSIKCYGLQISSRFVLLYYHSTKIHILPQHDMKQHSRWHWVGGCACVFRQELQWRSSQ